MGVSVEEDGCNFAIWAGAADIVDVCLFDAEDNNKVLERWRLTRRTEDKNNIFCGHIPDMKIGDAYGLRVGGDNYNKLLMDPYARAFSGKFNAVDTGSDSLYSDNHEKDSAPYMPRCVVIDESYDWGNGKRPNIPKNKVVLYEGHVKGLTNLLDEIPENIRGTYAGIASEPFIKYLQELGVNTLELLPIQQFVSEPQLQEKGLTNYWGYNTLGFFAPHGEYSSSGQNGEQVTEFKDMVKRLHEAGIEVIIDVVYNHTPEGSENGPTLMFKGLDEKEIYHLSNNQYCNYSGCGNTLNASSDTGLNIILESLHYWAKVMGVDGFRFDLASALAREQPNGQINMNGRFMYALQNDPVLSKLKNKVEPWDCSSDNSGEFGDIQQWNGRFRDTMRDFWLKNGNSGEFAASLSANLVDGHLPVEKTINYITAHDGFTSHDLVSYNSKHNYDNKECGNDGTNDNRSFNFGLEGQTDNGEVNMLRLRTARSMILSLLVAAGTPMLSHGDEILRTQKGNNNAYCQDNETTWMNWTFSEDQKKHHDFVANVIHFCMNHPTLTRSSSFTGQPVLGPGTESDIAWIRRDGHEFNNNDEAWKRKSVLGMYMSGIALKDISHPETVDDDCLIFYVNGTHNDKEVCLPKLRPYAGDYKIAIDSASGEVLLDGNEKPIIADKFVLKALSAVVLKRTSSHLQSSAN